MSSRRTRSSPSRGKATSSTTGRSPKTTRRQNPTGTELLPSRRSGDLDGLSVSASRISTHAHVEQVEHDVSTTSTLTSHTEQPMNGTDETGRSRDRLRLPDIDPDETSESSSMISPRSDGFPDEPLGSDESIAVDCHTNPTEVIVHGKNVKHIRVKFPPHPPNLEDIVRTKSGRSRLRRSQSGTNVKENGQRNTASSIDNEKLPYPHEETSLPAISESPSQSNMVSLHRQESSISLHSHDHAVNQYYPIHSANSGSSVDWDMKHRQDILAGLEYFEKKSSDFKHLHNQMVQELERVRESNMVLERLVEELQKEKFELKHETDELKIKLDQSEKENRILQDQTLSLWHGRVEVEEMYVTLKTDSQSEVNAMKEKLMEKEKEIHVLSATKSGEMKTAAAHQDKLSASKAHSKEATKGGLSEDNFELLHQISRLQEDIRKVTRERDALSETNCRQKQDNADMKTSMKEKSHELDSQYKRFMSLKKSFNDLMEENEKIKVQLRGRSNFGQHAHREQLGNSTWPKAGAIQPQNKQDKESVSYIDLPKGTSISGASSGAGVFKGVAPSSGLQQTTLKLNKGLQGKTTKTGLGHKRTKSLSENLPPVANPAR